MFQKYFLFFMVLTISTACGKAQQATDHAVEAMKRATIAEAHIHAQKEYNVADKLFKEMNNLLDNNDINKANETAQGVVDAANTAIEVARRNLAWKLIQQLRQTLQDRTDIEQSKPEIYKQASDLLITAQTAFDNKDYETAIADARKGLELLNINIDNLYQVKKGDTLWDLSDTFYKTPWEWPTIWDANKEQIPNPDLIYTNQRLKIPSL